MPEHGSPRGQPDPEEDRRLRALRRRDKVSPRQVACDAKTLRAHLMFLG
jgi:hypothetical protein